MNKVIAKFMGMECHEYRDSENIEYGWVDKNDNEFSLFSKGSGLSWLFESPPPFDKDFSWLMPIVEEIEKGDYGFKMCRKVVEVYIDSTKETILYVKEKSRIESLHKAVYLFALKSFEASQSGSSTLEEIKRFRKQKLWELYDKCTLEEQGKFNQMYKNIDEIPEEKIDWAIQQCERTINKKFLKTKTQ